MTSGTQQQPPQVGTKTLFHELAHEVMQQKRDVQLESGSMELEAGAVAYVLAKHLGLLNLSNPNCIDLHGAASDTILTRFERIQEVASKITRTYVSLESITYAR